MLLRVFVSFAIFCLTFTGGAQDPRKVAEIYETEVYGVSGNSPAAGEFLLSARLVVRPAELNGGTTSITLEFDSPTTAALIRLTKFSLPQEYESVLENQDEVWLETSRRGGPLGSGRYDITALAKGRGASAAAYDVLVTNALGQPAGGVRLDVRAGMGDAGISLGSQTVPANGRVRLHIPQPADKESDHNPGSFVYRPFSVLQITATDPTGQRQRLQFPGVPRPNIPPDFENIHLALMPRETTATAFRGRVLGPDDLPAPETQITYHWLAFPGMGGAQFQGYGVSIYPAPDGIFCTGVPQDFLQQNLGVLDLPASSTLNVNVSGGSGMTLRTDRENLVRLPHVEQVRLQLLDSSGGPLTGLKANNIRVEALTSSESGQEAGTSIHLAAKLTDSSNALLTLDNVPVPRRYAFEINDIKFEPVLVKKGTGDGVVQLRPMIDRAEVTGRVVAAENGQPLGGVYVLSAWESNSLHSMAKLSPDLLKSTWAAWDPSTLTLDSPDLDVNLGKNGTLFNVDAMMITDDEGRFTVVYENGLTPKTVHVFVPGRIGATARVLDMDMPSGTSAVYTVPDVALPLSASVTVPIIPPDKVPDKFLDGDGVVGSSLRNVFMAHVGFDREGPWRAALPRENSGKQNPWALLTTSGWAAPGNRLELAIPAGVKFQVTVSASYHPTIGTARWNDVGPLAPGENLVLPDQPVPAKIPFLVSVKKKEGTPAVGVSVRIDGQQPLTTDADGNVIGWTSGHVERIEVMLDSGWEVAAEKRDITVNPNESLTRVEMVIP